MKIVSKSRLEAFSDGVFAIIITIIVLELSTPNQPTWSAIVSSGWIWKFMAYVISFLLTASFWISHHNIINSVRKVTTRLLWLIVLTIFPISLIPVATAWYGEFPTSVAPSVVYAVDYMLIIIMLYWLASMTSRQIEDEKQRNALKKINDTRLILIIPGLISIVFAFIWPLVTAVMIALFTRSWAIRAVIRNKG
ncbi:DUF1211 domain-containing protein [Paucilactobacillus nenjiangensis]|uniref:DUF1211 domain-containing protein n=1 Tax=Paucilactobacillus nenjiangensis TaxID=1296540 RepID=A0A5P1X332_9LACO|nr:DUF1211 domain-containing protein [Paucilactobacillus nenjiangensis]